MKTSRLCNCLSALVALVALAAAQPARTQQPLAPTTSEIMTSAPMPSQPAEADPKEGQTTPASEVSRPMQPTRALPRELSPWSMFLSADIFVKGVMISLAFASLMTWTILFAKLGELALARRRLNAALRRIG